MKHVLSQHRRGVSLIEVMAVVIILGVTAAAVIPAVSLLDAGRRAAAMDDVAGMLTTARAAAMWSGEPHGVRIDLARQTCTALHDDGLQMEPMIGDDGMPIPPLTPPASYPGVAIAGVSRTLPGEACWFDFAGVPHVRPTPGSRGDDLDEDLLITLTGDVRIVVVAGAGGIELDGGAP